MWLIKDGRLATVALELIAVAGPSVALRPTAERRAVDEVDDEKDVRLDEFGQRTAVGHCSRKGSDSRYGTLSDERTQLNLRFAVHRPVGKTKPRRQCNSPREKPRIPQVGVPGQGSVVGIYRPLHDAELDE